MADTTATDTRHPARHCARTAADAARTRRTPSSTRRLCQAHPSLAAVDFYLPTPTASDCSGGGQDPDRRTGHTQQLIDVVLTTQWGKYRARDPPLGNPHPPRTITDTTQHQRQPTPRRRILRMDDGLARRLGNPSPRHQPQRPTPHHRQRRRPATSLRRPPMAAQRLRGGRMTHRHHLILNDHSMRFRKCRQCAEWWRTNTNPTTGSPADGAPTA